MQISDKQPLSRLADHQIICEELDEWFCTVGKEW